MGSKTLAANPARTYRVIAARGDYFETVAEKDNPYQALCAMAAHADEWDSVYVAAPNGNLIARYSAEGDL
jgi:hypothetical protein